MRHLTGWLLGAGALAVALNGCAGIEPGDYMVYRVAATSSSLSNGCYWQYQGADANVRNDSSTLRSSGTFILYAGAEEEFYLDIGEITLDGIMEGDYDDGEAYEFEGETVDINWDNANGTGSKRTTTVLTTVKMSVDGSLVFGELKVKTSHACSGNTCGKVAPKCTETIEFVGTEVDDVNLEHEVPKGIGTPPGGSTPPGNNNSGGSGSGGDDTGGGGGGGEGGGGGTCYSCSQILADNTIAEEDLCASSKVIFDAMMSCSCSTCSSTCGDNLCVSLSSVTTDCNSCVGESCYSQLSACSTDAPVN